MSFPQLRSKLLNQLATGAVAVAYTLAAESGAVTWTGTDAALNVGHAVTADAGSYSVTGTAVNLNKGQRLDVESDSIAVTGTDSTLSYASEADKVSVNPEWQRGYPRAFHPAVFGPKGFGFVVSLIHYSVDAAATAYDWTGTATTLKPARIATAESGTVSFTGTAAAVTKGVKLSASSSTYNTTGIAATTSVTRLSSADAASYTVSGTAASLINGLFVTAEGSSYTWTGTEASVIRALLATADSASYSIDGTDATLRSATSPIAVNYNWLRNYPRAFHPSHRKPFRFAGSLAPLVTVAEGSFDVTGGAANLTYQQLTPNVSQRGKAKRSWPRHFAPSPFGQLRSTRSANLAGTSTGFTALDAQSGILSVEDTPFTTLSTVRRVDLASGSYTVAGQDAAFHVMMPADSGGYTWTGTAATTLKASKVISSTGSYTWTGVTAEVVIGYKLSASSGTYPWTGSDVVLSTFLPASGSYVWTGTAATLTYSGEPTPSGPPSGSRMMRGWGV